MNQYRLTRGSESQHSTAAGAEQACRTGRFQHQPPPSAPRPRSLRLRHHLRNIRAAEMALWEATGGDVLSAASTKLFPLSIAGASKGETRP